jgi:tetratricopeptide (TPR) repeat protein
VAVLAALFMKKSFKIFALLGKAVFSAVLFVFLLSGMWQAYRQAKVTTLNHFMPSSFDYLFAVEKDPGQVNRIKLEKYELYYQKVARHKPALAEAHAFLGFCQYHLGKKKRAVVSFKKAVELNPQVFWFPYNLVAAFFKEGNYLAAADSFKSALGTNPETILRFMSRSKIYQDLLRELADPAAQMQTRIKTGYRDCYQMLILSLYHLGNFEETLRYAQAGLGVSVGDEAFFYRYAGLSLKALKEGKTGQEIRGKAAVSQLPEEEGFHVRLF